jgi:GNAT superfamily N-acetyltransferase
MNAFPIMKQLRTDLTLEMYTELGQEMKKDGYQLFALLVNNEIVSLVGVRMSINFYNKRHLYVYDMVTSSPHQSKGYGEQLLNHIHSYAKSLGAEFVSLESGIGRTEAHCFYEDKLGYEKWCFSFRRRI